MGICGCGRAIAAGAMCAVCLGAIGALPSAGVGSVRPVGTEITRLIPGRKTENEAERPHTPELEAAELPGAPEAEIQERHVLILDHPRYGLLNALNYLGYCDSCPIGLRDPGAICWDPCPGDAW